MRALLDTNVVLDVLLDRAPHVGPSAGVLGAIESGVVTGLLGATTVTTLHYLIAKALGVRAATKHIETLLSLCDVAPVTEEVLRDALSLGFADYEDAVLHEAARRARASVIVTRDQAGFRRATLPVVSPTEFLATLRRRD
ncbi:MAG: PIN domain-containing protein [Gemmatimonadaceae bacterium]